MKELTFLGISFLLFLSMGCAAPCVRIVETKAGFPAVDEVDCSQVKKDCERAGCEKGFDSHDGVYYYHFNHPY